jgi:hypothetical protein
MAYGDSGIARYATDIATKTRRVLGSNVAWSKALSAAVGTVADAGEILVTNRGSASLAWLGGATLETKTVPAHGRTAG